MWAKRGALDEVISAVPSLMLLGLVLIIFQLYFLGCALTSFIDFCGAKPADVTIDTAEFVASTRLLTLLQTPIATDANTVKKEKTLADALVEAYRVLPEAMRAGAIPGEDERAALEKDPVVGAYLREAQGLLKKVQPEGLPEKSRAAWGLRVQKIPGNAEVKALAIMPDLESFFVDEWLQQAVILPLPEKRGALRVELVLVCHGCTREAVQPFA